MLIGVLFRISVHPLLSVASGEQFFVQGKRIDWLRASSFGKDRSSRKIFSLETWKSPTLKLYAASNEFISKSRSCSPSSATCFSAQFLR